MFVDNPKTYMIEKIVACLTYPTMGLVGFIWIIIGQVTRSVPTTFTAYHCYLSIFLSLGYVIFNYMQIYKYIISNVSFLHTENIQLCIIFIHINIIKVL